MGSPSRNVQYHPPRLSEDRLNLALELAQFRAQVKAFAAVGVVSARSSPDGPPAPGWL